MFSVKKIVTIFIKFLLTQKIDQIILVDFFKFGQFSVKVVNLKVSFCHGAKFGLSKKKDSKHILQKVLPNYFGRYIFVKKASFGFSEKTRPETRLIKFSF